ncbi:PHB depolymerase family esterase [Bremerella sp. JC770]|uniref:carboxylesterase family protein n=1 Tax=Bremerella sp. JC770 TaxID=3232137 RepID=UPI003457BB6A
MPSDSQRQQEYEFAWLDRHGEQRRFPYLCYQPTEPPAGTKLPLLVFLHGAGERGTDLALVKKHGPPKLIDHGEDLPFVVVSPQCPLDQWWAMRENIEGLVQLTRSIQAEYPIDVGRTYLTGMSMGGYGAWATAAAYPDLFAAIVPICGGADLATAADLKGTPAWAFHGQEDEIVPVIRSEEIVNEVSKIGGDARLTIYDNVQHDSWSVTYANREIYDWLLSHEIHNRR